MKGRITMSVFLLRFMPMGFMAVLSALVGCSSDVVVDDLGANPFLQTPGGGKEDSAYINLRGLEVHVTLEADIEASPDQLGEAPADLAQFAVTYLTLYYEFYLEILAEDATASDRVEWLVDGSWIDSNEARHLEPSQLTHFRMRDVNAVVLNEDASGLQQGAVFEAVVPLNPYTVVEEAGESCAELHPHVPADQDTYWFVWCPDRPDCSARTQEMTVTVTELLPQNPESYPEYDRLWEDGRLQVVVLFGVLEDGTLARQHMGEIAAWLVEAGFVEVPDAPLGQRFLRAFDDRSVVVDLYGPDIYRSVSDRTNFMNWQRAVSEHEVVIYNGHSVLGTGYAFEQVDYPDFYQIYYVASCLSYQYYVRPILGGKGGWDAVDVISNTEITQYQEHVPLTGAFLARLTWGFENEGRASWQDIMEATSEALGHARFGVSGARDNCFSPEGDRCD